METRTLYSRCTALMLAAAVSSSVTACGEKLTAATDLDEVGSTATDAMKSVDEATNGGSFAALDRRSPARKALDWLIPDALAGSCRTVTLSTCLNGVRTRTFDSCTTGAGALTHTGAVTLTWRNAEDSLITDCRTGQSGALAEGSYITRTVERTITGRRGASIVVTSTDVTAYDTSVTFGSGQKLTKSSTGATVSILGMNRKATKADGTKVFDISTKTSEDLVYTGTSRATRVLTSGQIQIFHNLAQYTVTLTPNNVTWSADCDTPTSGSMKGTMSGSVTGEVEVTFTGCGTYSVVQSKDGETAETSGTSDTSDSG